MRFLLAVLGVAAAGLYGCARRADPPSPMAVAHAASAATSEPTRAAEPVTSPVASSSPTQVAGSATRQPDVAVQGASAAEASAAAQHPNPVPPEPRLPAEERTWVYPDSAVGRMVVVVSIPERAASERLPLLIAMHGRGEALKGPDRGARGWIDDYDLLKGARRLQHPPLHSADFKSFVTASRLSNLNAALRDKPYRGLIIACPYTPDILQGDDPFSKARPLAGFLVDELLPRLNRETPTLGSPTATGIDGVSLGGRAALSVGLLRPRAFGVIAGLQAAFDAEQAPTIATLAAAAVKQNPALKFRLFTSEGDYFRAANGSIADALRAAGMKVRFEVLQGPHDYDFNRGPGALEMLLFHDRVLRGEAAP